MCIATYLPREGPETFSNSSVSIIRSVYRYLSTSGGAGNSSAVTLTLFISPYRSLSTSRGAGNSRIQIAMNRFTSLKQPIYPARGRKPFPRIIHLLNCRFRYRNLFTSRGAGNSLYQKWMFSNNESIDPYLPREGPETSCQYSDHASHLTCIVPYLPREGTETSWLLRLERYFLYSCIDTYLPRERPETGRRVNLLSFSLTGIATYQPREGPETLQELGTIAQA